MTAVVGFYIRFGVAVVVTLLMKALGLSGAQTPEALAFFVFLTVACSYLFEAIVRRAVRFSMRMARISSALAYLRERQVRKEVAK